jgi:hypothetical protein
MPDLKDVGVGAIVAAAGGLAFGLAKASGWLTAGTAGPVFLGLRGWQWLNLGAFAVNVVSVSIPGRIDGKVVASSLPGVGTHSRGCQIGYVNHTTGCHQCCFGWHSRGCQIGYCTWTTLAVIS